MRKAVSHVEDAVITQKAVEGDRSKVSCLRIPIFAGRASGEHPQNSAIAGWRLHVEILNNTADRGLNRQLSSQRAADAF